MYGSTLTTTYSFNFFAPTILIEMGYGPISAQLHSFPPYTCAAVSTLVVCRFSDHYQHRWGFLISGVLLGVVGYGIVLCQTHYPNIAVGVKYFALFPLIISAFIVQPLTVAWVMNNCGGRMKRAFASGCQIGLGSAGGFVASNVFFERDKPYFRVGFGVCLGLLLLNGVLAMVAMGLLKRENRIREVGGRDWRWRGEDAGDLGDEHSAFRYIY